ncbi:MAG: sulfate adenylyltransferase [Planctomycetes bacterium]|nr:sulfate adenylyltransferase [Planctomycetota bacterium]
MTVSSGLLSNPVFSISEAISFKSQAASLSSITLKAHEFWDLKLLATGGYAPLDGFINQADYLGVITNGRLHDGQPWTVPITLGLDEVGFEVGATVALKDGENVVARLIVREIYERDFEAEARGVFQTTEEAHPGVARIKHGGKWLISGELTTLPEAIPQLEQGLIWQPAEIRTEIKKRGWKNVVAFQTRNPIHRAHEHLIRTALETADGLLIHPLVGETKEGDIPADVRTDCYRTLIEKYFPANRVILAALPAPMRYAGPKEAIHHALIRRNYGATKFIVGRDHAGVGDYYGTYDAQKIFETYEQGELGIDNLNFEHSFFCKGVGGYATDKTSPFGPEQRVFVSGTKLREILAAGERPPEEVVRPEIADILIKYYADK